MTDKYIKQY